MFDRQGDTTPPCGEPSVAWRRSSSSRTPAFSHLSIIRRITPSVTRLSRKARRWECEIDRWVETSLGTVAFAEPCLADAFATVASPSRLGRLCSPPPQNPAGGFPALGSHKPHSPPVPFHTVGCSVFAYGSLNHGWASR